MNPTAIPNVLTIAGVDPSGGAGIVADIKAISAQRAYACAVVAALTAQNTQGVTGVLAIDPAFVARQIDTLYADVRIDALKIGMVGQAAVIEVVAARVAAQATAHRVLDPVMIAKSGDALLEKSAISALRDALLPLATIITPNLPEAGVLLEARTVETVKEMYRVAERLRELMPHSGARRATSLKHCATPINFRSAPAMARCTTFMSFGGSRQSNRHDIMRALGGLAQPVRAAES